MSLFSNIFGNSFSASLIGSLASTFVTAYTTKKAYESQKDASEIQSEAANEQVKAAGFQQEAAGRQEIAAIESQRLSELNAIDSEIQTARQVENQRGQQQQVEAESRARAAASGVTLTGSTGNFLSEQERVNSEQLGWLKKTGERAADELRSQGETAYQTALSQASLTRAGAASTLAGAAQTRAGSRTTRAGAYSSLASGATQMFNTGSRAGWF